MATEKPVYWNRIGYVAIEGRNGKMFRFGGETDGLDFKFDGEVVADITPTFNVSVLGLSLENINTLTVWNPAESFSQKRKIEVYAGYSADGIANPLFSGFIIEAIPTNPPEMWLNFKCMMNVPNDGAQKSGDKDMQKRPVSEIWNDIAKLFGCSGKWEVKRISASKEIVFKLGGRAPNILVDDFTSMLGIIAFSRNGVLVCKDRRPWADPDNPTETISTETGLLGIAAVSIKGATIKRRLSDTVRCFDCVRIESKIMPKANGAYTIIKKRHVGHLRGNDWFTELELIRAEKK